MQRNEPILIEGLLSGRLKIDHVDGTSSELITAILAVGRYESLPPSHYSREKAWASLEPDQQTIVRQYNPTFRSIEHRPQSVQRLMTLAMGDSYPGGIVADFFLSLFATEKFGGFDVGNITVLDQPVVNDIAEIITLIGLSLDGHPPDWLIAATEVEAIVARWRPPRLPLGSLYGRQRPNRPERPHR